jgi:hypothetical protein
MVAAWWRVPSSPAHMPLLRQRPAVAGRLASLVVVGWLAVGGLAACGDPLVLEDVPTVTLSPATITAAPGDTFRVRVTATGGAPVGSVVLAATGGAARVDANGLVTAVAPGAGVISATFDFNGQRVTGSIPVTVLGITLEPTTAAIAVGATTFLRATPVGDFAAYGGFRWSSSDSSVAFVDAGGGVRGIRPGVARIAVSAINNPRVRAEATVTVIGNPTLVTGIVVQPTAVTLQTGATTQLTAAVQLGAGAPPTTSRDVFFRTSDSTVATVSATGLVTARRGGTAIITVAAVAAPTVTQAVGVIVRDPGFGPRLTFQSITNTDTPPAIVDLTAVRGRIRVTLNYIADPALDARRLELWLGGRRAAGTDTLPRPAGGGVASVSLDIDTAERDPVTNARLYPNGQLSLEARLTFAASGSSQTQLMIVPLQLTLANP